MNEMKSYIGVKQIKARPMSREEYNNYRGWELPEDENGEDDGMLVEYTDGGASNDPRHEGYISWSPIEVFNNAYRRVDGMTFGLAIEAMKLGKKVCRVGWNGIGMYVALQEGSEILPENARGGAALMVAKSLDPWDTIKINPHMSIKNVDDSISTWVPSVNDCLAEDWMIVD